jgi:hypothetical protein
MTADEKNGTESVEVVNASGATFEVTTPPDWQQEVWSRCQNKCSGCGSTAKLTLKLIVPLEAGGQKTAENAYIICRACEIATDASRPKMQHSNNRPINFWVSRRLFDRMNNGLCSDRGFKSKSALIRYLMGKYISSEPQFDDLEHYQDAEGVDDAKVNAWVPKDTYETFKTMLDRRGMSVTDAVKALVMVYESEKDRDDQQNGDPK